MAGVAMDLVHGEAYEHQIKGAGGGVIRITHDKSKVCHQPLTDIYPYTGNLFSTLDVCRACRSSCGRRRWH
jgi:hypothetical protein